MRAEGQKERTTSAYVRRNIETYSLVQGDYFDLGGSLYKPDAPKTTAAARI